MAIAGRKPKPDDLKRNRVKPVHDWTEVLDIPFQGGPPLLGRRSKAIQQWWAVISTMPHCVLWAPADWQFAADTARLVSAFYRGEDRLAGEIRQREKIMGTTIDARRDLRIRYIPVAPQEEEAEGVTSLADYRASLGE